MKAFWKTYLAIVVLAALGSYVFFVDAKKPAASETGHEKLFAVEKEKIQEIAVARADGETLRIVKDGEGWKLSAPSPVAADLAQVDSLLSTIAAAEMNEVVIDQPPSLAPYGLDKPRLTLTVRGGSASEELQLGGKTPDDAALYAKQPAKARVFTIPSYLEGTFDKKPFDLRDRSVLHVKRDAIQSVDVTGPEGAYSLAKTDKGEWAFTAPMKSLANRWSVDALTASFENLQMDAIAAENAADLKPFGLDKPLRTVILGLADGGAKRLEIGKVAGGSGEKFYARDASRALVAEIPPAVPTELAKGVAELRAKRLFDVAAHEVSGIELTADGEKRTFSRTTTKTSTGESFLWKKTAPETKDLATDTVQDVLFRIGGVEVVQFIDKPDAPASYGLDTPALKVTLSHDGGKAPATFEVARKGDTVYARREGDDAILKLDDKAPDLIEAFKKL